MGWRCSWNRIWGILVLKYDIWWQQSFSWESTYHRLHFFAILLGRMLLYHCPLVLISFGGTTFPPPKKKIFGGMAFPLDYTTADKFMVNWRLLVMCDMQTHLYKFGFSKRLCTMYGAVTSWVEWCWQWGVCYEFMSETVGELTLCCLVWVHCRDDEFHHNSLGAPCGARAPQFPPCPFTSSSFALLLFPFFHWLYLFSSFVHPFPFYQNSPTLFPGRRS